MSGILLLRSEQPLDAGLGEPDGSGGEGLRRRPSARETHCPDAGRTADVSSSPFVPPVFRHQGVVAGSWEVWVCGGPSPVPAGARPAGLRRWLGRGSQASVAGIWFLKMLLP